MNPTDDPTRHIATELLTRTVASTDTDTRLQALSWLAIARETLRDTSLSTTERAVQLYRTISPGQAVSVVLEALGTAARGYRDLKLPWALKVAVPVTLAAATVVGGQGAGIAALGTAIGLPLLLLVFIGAAGITAVLETFLGQEAGDSYVGVVLAIIAQDEVLRRSRKALREAMAASPAAPRAADLPTDLADLHEHLLGLDPHAFEAHVMSFFQRAGYLAWVTRQSNDAGVDGFARHPEGLILVQCKRYGPDNPVGRPTVQQLKGVIEENDAWRGVLVTTSRFTREAVESAGASERVVLVDAGALLRWHREGLRLSGVVVEPGPMDEAEAGLPEAARARLWGLMEAHEKGFLSDTEFARQRAALLEEGDESAAAPAVIEGEVLPEDLPASVRARLAGLDLAWRGGFLAEECYRQQRLALLASYGK